ncbi:hypothetical protein AVEN_54105-1 [Araneus ventricosus]|uniref:Uncharacterized protein n=1 Tax=Araneus ventricosus TaxID=182803 RepID=A0A4Y2BV98_ARAVE|nr:hypothetical protein AVEN_54105-1 [Araneus ventricosus]
MPLKIRRVLSLLHIKSCVRGQTSSRWCNAEVWRGVPAQVSSLSSDCGSKLRGPNQNSPRVASKRGVIYITKLNRIRCPTAVAVGQQDSHCCDV